MENWDLAFGAIVNYFMKIMDWMWSLTLPATDIPLYVLWIIGATLAVIFRVLGSSPQLSTMSKTTVKATSNGLGSLTLKKSSYNSQIAKNKEGKE